MADWWLYSVNHQRFNDLLSGSSPDCERMLLSAVHWDDDGLPKEDIKLLEQLVRQIAAAGISFHDLDSRALNAFDDLLQLVLEPEGLCEWLSVQPLSTNGLPHDLCQELVLRASPSATFLPMLLSGRRFKQGGKCRHVVLASDEVSLLRQEAAEAMQRDKPWTQSWVAALVNNELMDPLSTISLESCLLATTEYQPKPRKAIRDRVRALEAPPVEVQKNSKGWILCPNCGVRFNDRDSLVWNGSRHRPCGQRLVIKNLANTVPRRWWEFWR